MNNLRKLLEENNIKTRKEQENETKKQKALYSVKNVKLLETGASNMWYKAWGYIEDDTLYVGRYADVLKGRPRKDIFNLGFGLYTDKACESNGLQNLFSEYGKIINEDNEVIIKRETKKDLISFIDECKELIEREDEGISSLVINSMFYEILKDVIYHFGFSKKDMRTPTTTNIKKYVNKYYVYILEKWFDCK